MRPHASYFITEHNITRHNFLTYRQPNGPTTRQPDNRMTRQDHTNHSPALVLVVPSEEPRANQHHLEAAEALSALEIALQFKRGGRQRS